VFTILFNMKFPTKIIKYLDSAPSTVSSRGESAGSDDWEEDSLTVSSDLGSGFRPDHYGSFEELPSTTSSTTSFDFGGSPNDALDGAQVARLTNEEAGIYLKSILKVNPTIENFNATTAGDARADPILVTHGSPWTPVTRRHSTMHVKVKPGRPTVEGGRADRNWRTEPGLYSARLQKSFRSAPTPTPKRDKKSYKKPHFNKKKSLVDGYRKDGMPAYLVKDLDRLDTEEFEVALNYWMNNFNFIGYPTTMVPYQEHLAAYDESLYPNEHYKPTGRRHNNNHRRVNVPIQRNQALVFACNGAECWKSYKASEAAVRAGYTRVNWFRGGLPEWRAASRPVAQLQ
jgi:rhodanese-related sulfurtransferase